MLRVNAIILVYFCIVCVVNGDGQWQEYITNMCKNRCKLATIISKTDGYILGNLPTGPMVTMTETKNIVSAAKLSLTAFINTGLEIGRKKYKCIAVDSVEVICRSNDVLLYLEVTKTMIIVAAGGQDDEERSELKDDVRKIADYLISLGY